VGEAVINHELDVVSRAVKVRTLRKGEGESKRKGRSKRPGLIGGGGGGGGSVCGLTWIRVEQGKKSSRSPYRPSNLSRGGPGSSHTSFET